MERYFGIFNSCYQLRIWKVFVCVAEIMGIHSRLVAYYGAIRLAFSLFRAFYMSS